MDFPWGLPNLSCSDVDTIKLGNATARAACRIMRACLRMHVPFVLENPSASNLFLLPPMVSLLATPGVHQITVDQCQFGARWCKRTVLLCHGLDDEHRLKRTCRSRGGVCSNSGQPHYQLEGKAPSGVNWTHIAQTFPKALAGDLAWCLLQQAFSKIANAIYSVGSRNCRSSKGA